MSEETLKYLRINIDTMDEAFKVDALLSRLIGSENFTIAKQRRKDGPIWIVGAWLSESEYTRFHRILEEDEERRWDREYEELLENR